MASPTKNWDNASRLRNRNQIENKVSKEFTELKIPQTERLRSKNSDATPLPVRVMMSHITYECAGTPNKKLKPKRHDPRMSISNTDVVRLVDASYMVKFTAELLMSSSSIFSLQK